MNFNHISQHSPPCEVEPQQATTDSKIAIKTKISQRRKPHFFPPAGPQEAMSNWVVKPAEWIESTKESSNYLARFVCKYENGCNKLGVFAIALLSAPMDAYYNGVWFSIKASALVSRETIRIVTCGSRGQFCKELNNGDLAHHGRMTYLFSRALFWDAWKGLYEPQKLIDEYRARRMIMGKEERIEYLAWREQRVSNIQAQSSVAPHDMQKDYNIYLRPGKF